MGGKIQIRGPRYCLIKLCLKCYLQLLRNNMLATMIQINNDAFEMKPESFVSVYHYPPFPVMPMAVLAKQVIILLKSIYLWLERWHDI